MSAGNELSHFLLKCLFITWRIFSVEFEVGRYFLPALFRIWNQIVLISGSALEKSVISLNFCPLKVVGILSVCFEDLVCLWLSGVYTDAPRCGFPSSACSFDMLPPVCSFWKVSSHYICKIASPCTSSAFFPLLPGFQARTTLAPSPWLAWLLIRVFPVFSILYFFCHTLIWDISFWSILQFHSLPFGSL